MSKKSQNPLLKFIFFIAIALSGLCCLACSPAKPQQATPLPTSTVAINPTATQTPLPSPTPLPSATFTPAVQLVTFSGRVERGQTFTHPFDQRFTFELVPIEYGWYVAIRDAGLPGENLARLTPPFHFVPNPRYLEGWHFRNADNSGPNDGSVNAPQQVRDFIFSPRVGRTIDYPPTPEQMEQVQNDGRGALTITQLALGNLQPGATAHIEVLVFEVTLQFQPIK